MHILDSIENGNRKTKSILTHSDLYIFLIDLCFVYFVLIISIAIKREKKSETKKKHPQKSKAECFVKST